MNKNTIIKLILLIFFITFFGFLFYYFYNPIAEQKKQQEQENENIENTGLFPTGEQTSSETQNPTQTEQNQPNNNTNEIVQKEEIPRLRQISNTPTAGTYIEKISKTEIFDINKQRDKKLQLDLDGEYSEIRYVSMKNNHLYRTYDFTMSEERISNITIPKIFEALFFDIDNYIVRYINDYNYIKSYSIKISDKTKEEVEEEKQNNPDSENYKLKKFAGIFLPDNIKNISLNKAQKKIFYTKEVKSDDEKKEDYISGIVASHQAEGKKEIFTSELKEWNFNFNSPDYVLATTKPASTTGSYSMSINTTNASTKAQSKIKTALNGLPNYNFTKILYSYKKNDNYVLYIKDVKTQEETEILGVNSIVDKCVWSKDNIHIYCATTGEEITSNNLENWYKGKLYFNNNDLQVINSKNQNTKYIYINISYNKNFDIVDLQIDDLEKYVYFKDKKTDFYWSYKIKEDIQKEVEE